MIAAKEYRSISPSMTYNTTTLEILRLNAAGLVHHPAVEGAVLAEAAAPPAVTDGAAGFLASLDLAGPSTEDDIATRLMKPMVAFRSAVAQVTGETAPKAAGLLEVSHLTADPRRFMTVEAVATLARGHQEALAGLKTLRVQHKVETACDDGHVTHEMRSWAAALCHSDETGFDGYCSGVPRFGSLFNQPTAFRPFKPSAPAHDPAEVAICAQLGLKPGAPGQ